MIPVSSALKLLLVAAMILCPIWTSAIASEKKEIIINPESEIHALLDNLSVQPLVDHHRSVMKKNQVEKIARELLTLTQGEDWTADPVSYISAYTETEDDNRDYRHAKSLGLWLGSVRNSISERKFSSSDAANWFRSLLTELDLLSPNRHANRYSEIADEIADNGIKVTEAIELLAYGNVTSSSVTTPIGEGISIVNRRIAE